ncbi:uncharacterized protein MONOS_16578 [Monocercomonoides exilis]|uniref:uncharacterized protein n=1 Tax=Monocercomonoides exilis TaxID=2049356 RepID=UPI00355A7FA5|nr:hypothetical protein MONOS_16578 [Monocercomonoides exilis]|eukprot:MONOS_16578.1-p1 / transcript=MONOS_16578.1 / gene=MONOS_16578 / organism=Monocercomonoides_exilis_PA203 / gene_product=unspecified product / transcript_product=unspecified product / location=Mono_scaffold01881:2018-3392(+) / protein_length=303 / sequence_SO=supercontig / SO=protein_coding / is_pseudo=false
MEKVKPSLARLLATSEMRSMKDDTIKVIYAYDILNFSEQEIEECKLISRGSLQRAIKARNEGRKIRKCGRPTLFTISEEDDFEQQILEEARSGKNPTKKFIEQMANELLLKKRKDDEDTKKVDKHWIDRFLTRHPKIELVKPKALPIGRVAHTCKMQIKPLPQLIFNIDETSTSFSDSEQDLVASSSSTPSFFIAEPSLPSSTTIVFMTSADGCRYITPVLIPLKTIPHEYRLASTSLELSRDDYRIMESERNVANEKEDILRHLPDSPPEWAQSEIEPKKAPEGASYGAVYRASDRLENLFK